MVTKNLMNTAVTKSTDFSVRKPEKANKNDEDSFGKIMNEVRESNGEKKEDTDVSESVENAEKQPALQENAHSENTGISVATPSQLDVKIAEMILQPQIVSSVEIQPNNQLQSITQVENTEKQPVTGFAHLTDNSADLQLSAVEMHNFSENIVTGENIQEGVKQTALTEPVSADDAMVKIVQENIPESGAENSGTGQNPQEDILNSGILHEAGTVQSGEKQSVETVFAQEEVHHTSQTDMKDTISKLAEKFASDFKTGKTEMEITLNPEHLGKVTIKVDYDGGTALVSILCTDKNADIISKNSQYLAGILKEYTGEDTHVVIEQPHSDYLQQDKNSEENNRGYESGNNRRNHQSDNENETIDFLQQLRLGLM